MSEAKKMKHRIPRWNDEFVRVTGAEWMIVAGDRDAWKTAVGEAYAPLGLVPL